MENNVLQTSKYNKAKHGWGIKSVESMVEKVGDVFDYSFDTVKFKAVVTLFK